MGDTGTIAIGQSLISEFSYVVFQVRAQRPSRKYVAPDWATMPPRLKGKMGEQLKFCNKLLHEITNKKHQVGLRGDD